VRANPGRAELLDLLHHWRSERYVHRVATNVDRHLFSSCFTRVEIEGLEDARRRAEAGERLVFVANHQSEYDWMLLQTYLAQRYIRTAIQAGENLYVGPIDTFLRKCGAFMTIRDRRSFYARHWLADWTMRALRTRPYVLTKEQYNKLYLAQIKRVLGEGLHLMIFPGYEIDRNTGEAKYGRSYSGQFAELSPYVFLVLNAAIRQMGIDGALYVPVNISYERIPEDIVFREYQARSRKSKIAKYVYDHYYAFMKMPFARRIRDQRSRVLIRFGEGIPADRHPRARELAAVLHEQMGKLMRVYESTLVFASLDDRYKMSREELDERLAASLDRIEAHGLDTAPLYDADRRRLPTEDLLARTVKVYNFPDVPIIPSKSYMTLEYDDREVFIHHPHLAAYYGNKLKHILQADAA
jgi:hypothetical protein